MLEKNFSSNYPQEETLYLPPQAVARFGKSRVTTTQISPDGNVIAVASRIGVWLYDVHTYCFLSLIGINGTGILSKIAFSPDSKRIATADWDGVTKLWDIETGANLSTFIHTDYVISIAFSSDGKYLATSSRDGNAKLWNIDAEAEILTVPHEDSVIKVLFSPEDRHLVTGSWDGNVTLWDLPTQKHLATLSHEAQEKSVTFSSGNTETFNEGGIEDIVFSPDGKYLATRGRRADKTIRLWEVKTGEQIWKVTYEALVGHLVFSPDGKYIATCEQNGQVNLRDVQTGKSCLTVNDDTSIEAFTFSTDGSHLSTGSTAGVVNVWCVKSRKNMGSLTGLGAVDALQYLPNGTLLVEMKTAIEVWSLNEEHLGTLPHPLDSWGWRIRFSPNGKHLAGLSKAANAVQLWDMDTGETIEMFEGGEGSGKTLAFPSEGQCFGLSISTFPRSGIVQLWNEETLASFSHGGLVDTVEMSLNGTLVATGGRDKKVKLWQVETQQCFQTLSGHIGRICSLAFSPDGALLVSGGGDTWERQEGNDGIAYFFTAADGTVDTTTKVWKVATGKNIATLESNWMVRAVAFSPDGTHLATGVSKTVTLWCTQTWQSVATLDTVKIESLAFSPDGARLALGGTWPEQKIQIWDVKVGELVVEFSGHKSDVESLAFSPDGCLLASGGFDGVIYLWDMTPYL